MYGIWEDLAAWKNPPAGPGSDLAFKINSTPCLWQLAGTRYSQILYLIDYIADGAAFMV